MEPIRILHVVGTMDLGGIETLIMNIYRNIDRTKIQFDFLCHNRIDAKYTEEIMALGGKMYMVPGISHVGLVNYQRKIYNFFVQHPEYKTVHSHQGTLSGMILSQAKKAGVPNRFSHAHSTYTSKNFFKKIQFAFFKSFFTNSVTHAFACADIAGKSLYKGRLYNNFEIIPNGIDADKFVFSLKKREVFREEFGFDDKIVIGHIGRFMREKNHKFIIRVFKEMLRKNPDLQLVLIGEGELMPDIKSLVKELGIEDNVYFLGARYDVSEFLSAIDLLLFPSIFEGLSVSMIEAQASGVPILTSNSVSSEVAITDRVNQISLNLSAENWADIALDMICFERKTDRTGYAQKVKCAGYDIKSTALKLQYFYIDKEMKF